MPTTPKAKATPAIITSFAIVPTMCFRSSKEIDSHSLPSRPIDQPNESPEEDKNTPQPKVVRDDRPLKLSNKEMRRKTWSRPNVLGAVTFGM